MYSQYVPLMQKLRVFCRFRDTTCNLAKDFQCHVFESEHADEVCSCVVFVCDCV